MFGIFDRFRTPDVRRIGPQAAEACAKIHAQSFAHPWPAAEFETLLAARDVVGEAVMAAAWWERRGGLAGFVLSRIVLDEAEILTIAVAPEHRRKGLGGALLGSHLATLTARGVKALFLEVEAGNTAALALYAAFDFHQVGERKAYYRKQAGPPATALLLRRDCG